MIYDSNMSQVAFLLFSLLRQNVTFVSVLTLNFTGSGKREALFCTGISLYLWHFVIKYLIVNNSSDRQPDAHGVDKKVGLRALFKNHGIIYYVYYRVM